MTKIENKNVPSFELDHTYIVDQNDDNAERRKLCEAFVNKVTILKDGATSFTFQLAGQQYGFGSDANKLTIYYDINAYKSTGKPVSASYELVSDLIEHLGVDKAYYNMLKPSVNSSQFLTPQGYIITDDMKIEAVDFTEPWVFKRDLLFTKDDKGKILATSFGPWSHNANFNGKEPYPTREAALANHKIVVVRLTGKEEEA